MQYRPRAARQLQCTRRGRGATGAALPRPGKVAQPAALSWWETRQPVTRDTLGNTRSHWWHSVTCRRFVCLLTARLLLGYWMVTEWLLATLLAENRSTSALFTVKIGTMCLLFPHWLESVVVSRDVCAYCLLSVGRVRVMVISDILSAGQTIMLILSSVSS